MVELTNAIHIAFFHNHASITIHDIIRGVCIPSVIYHPKIIHMELFGSHISGIFLLLFVGWEIETGLMQFQLDNVEN